MYAKKESTNERIVTTNQKDVRPRNDTQADRRKAWFKGIRPVHKLLKRERKKELTTHLPKARTRKPAKTLQEYKYENKRLKMENELLRDFLSLTERK